MVFTTNRGFLVLLALLIGGVGTGCYSGPPGKSDSGTKDSGTDGGCTGTDVTVSTFAGDGTAATIDITIDGPGDTAKFYNPRELGFDQQGNLYVADSQTWRIRKVTPDRTVSTVAGNGKKGYLDADALTAQFSEPVGLGVDLQGNIYIADQDIHRIRKLANGMVSTFAGSGTAGKNNGVGTAATFRRPFGIATAKDGSVYVGDFINNIIRKIKPDGTTSTFAGDGSPAIFKTPGGLVLDDQENNLYVADVENHRIQKVSLSDGRVTTFAGTGTIGYIDGSAASAKFNSPNDIAIDTQGNLYVADTENHRIRKITQGTQGVIVSTLAGSGDVGKTDGTTAVPGAYKDGPGKCARFYSPRGIAVDKQGAIYVADSDNQRIRKITP